jgi:radical SAM protein with 4Fe4S-binding SPASM domain
VRKDLRLSLPGTGDRISAILKLAGESCNINCHYCFEKRKPYPNAVRLSPETLERFLQLCDGRPLHLELHGGEPLLIGRPRMARLFAILRAYPGPLTLALQTNGTLLDDAWIDFLLQERPDLDIGVSLDGPADVTDVYRVDYRERGVTEKIEAALQRLADRGLKVGVIATVTRPCLGRERELIDYFAGFSAMTYLKFGPCLDFDVTTKVSVKSSLLTIARENPAGKGIPAWGTTPSEYAEFLIQTFEVWREAAFRQFLIEPLYSLMRTLAGRQPSLCHFSSQKCAYVLTLYPDGRLGSCDELRMPDAALGHVDDFETIDDALGLATNSLLLDRMNALYQKCSGCALNESCGGGCLATRLQYVGTPLDDEYCGYRARLIGHVRTALGMTPLADDTPWDPTGRQVTAV